MKKKLWFSAVSMFMLLSAARCSGGLTEIMQVPVPLAGLPSSTEMLMPEASGESVKKNEKAEIDYSNIKDGYVMVRFIGETVKELRVTVTGPSGDTYTYILNPGGAYEVLPFSDGSGGYRVGVYENIVGNKYSTIISMTTDVILKDEFAPFLRPNQYVNYTLDCETVKKAAELTENTKNLPETIAAVYQYVTQNIQYDKELAASVKSGYLPDIDLVLSKGKGICFDYAAVTTAMLRSRQIPTKLVVGYTGDLYHAWINVYSEETGWIDNVIYFDGESWILMDPTFASGQSSSDKIAQYVGNGQSYVAKYLY